MPKLKTIVDLYPNYAQHSYADRIIVSIYYLRIMIERQLEQRLEPYDISAAQFRTLMIIRENHPKGVPIYNLRQFVTEPRNGDVSRMVARLEKSGWVKRVADKKDKRSVLVFITHKGKKLLSQVDDTTPTLRMDIDKLTDEKARVLYEHLQILVDVFANLKKKK